MLGLREKMRLHEVKVGYKVVPILQSWLLFQRTRTRREPRQMKTVGLEGLWDCKCWFSK